MNLSQCIQELRAIVQELRDIEMGIRNDFIGIGQDMCANSVGAIADHYQGNVLRRLERVDRNRVAEQ